MKKAKIEIDRKRNSVQIKYKFVVDDEKTIRKGCVKFKLIATNYIIFSRRKIEYIYNVKTHQCGVVVDVRK